MIETLKRVDEESLREIKNEMEIRKTREVFVLFPLGSQFDHLIKMKLAELGVFCITADPASVKAEDIKRLKPKGIILSGGPVSVHIDPPPFDCAIFNLGIPTLGICLGFQLWAQHIGARVWSSAKREFGVLPMLISDNKCKLFRDCGNCLDVLQSHGDIVLPAKGMKIFAYTENSSIAAANSKHLWGVQFHPEVSDTQCGLKILENFCFGICGAVDRYPAENEAEKKITWLKEKIGGRKVLLALSGGSDSSVCAYLLKKALSEENGAKIFARYIQGIDRPDDERHVIEYFGNQDWIDLKIIDATSLFLRALAGKKTMKEKRIAMRGVYKQVLEDEAEKCGAEAIVQGSLYTDICESGFGYDSGAKKARIKLHHNVGLDFSLEEICPLSDCVKDNARNIGRAIGTPEILLSRHPFPGPGLVVRIDGEITEEKLRIAREADRIYLEELYRWKLYEKIWQAGIIVTDTIHTCTKGDGAANGWVLIYFAVNSVNGFTAQPFDLPFDFRIRLSKRLGNEIKEVGATSYRDSSKPYSTIELG